MDDNTTNFSPVEKKPSRKKAIWVTIIILLLIASTTALGMLYFSQQATLNADITALKDQNAQLTKDNKALQADNKDSSSSSDYREIPELGVKYKITNQTKDVTYAYTFDTKNAGVGISTTKLINVLNTNSSAESSSITLAGTCSGQITMYKPGDKQVLAAVSTPIEQVKGVKKIGGNYFTFSKPQAACSDDKTVQTQADDAIQAAQTVFNSLQAI